MPLFIDDIDLPQQLYGTTLRATIPRGRILDIRLPELPPDCFAVTARDIRGEARTRCYGSDLPFLAGEEVAYFGEPILLLAAPRADLAAELARRVEISYTEEAAVYNLEEAGESHILERVVFRRGDPEGVFEGAERIIEGQYRTGPLEHYYPDTHGALAQWDGSSLIVYAATQDPFTLREALSILNRLPLRRVRVKAPSMGISLEGKMIPSLQIAGHASLLAIASGRPVKLVYDRDDDFRFTPKSHPSLIRHRTVLDGEGNLEAMFIEVLLDAGAYRVGADWILKNAAFAACGCYRCENVQVEVKLVTTNKVPSGFFRGMGSYQAFFASEVHAARLAELVQMDPVSWKKQNLMAAGTRTLTGEKYKGFIGLKPVLEEAVRLSDFIRKHAAYATLARRRQPSHLEPGLCRGIGLSLCSQDLRLHHGREQEAPPRLQVRASLDSERRLTLYSSVIDMGQGVSELFTGLAMEILGLEPEQVVLEPVDTDFVPDTGLTTPSSTFTVAARLVEQACLEIKKRLERGEPPIQVRKFLTFSPKRASAGSDPRLSWAATVVELEVDPATLQANTLGIWMVVEAGMLFSRDWARRQLEGGIIRALGHTCLERLVMQEGRVGPAPGSDYQVPGILDVPPIQVAFLEGMDPRAPRFAKGFEELPLSGVAPAFATALSQASGLYLDRMPVTPEEVQACLEEK